LKKAWIFVLVLLPLLAHSQRRQARFEIVAMGGAASYSGDLGYKSTSFLRDHPQKLGPAMGLGMRCHITNSLAVRGNFNYAMISGADSLGDNKWRTGRNLSFRSPIYEGSLLLEFSLINWGHLYGERVNSAGGGRTNLYLFGGMSFFSFNPQAYYNGEWVDLQPLGTEGQGIRPGSSKYSLTSTALVFGAGYRVLLGGRWSFGIETGIRKTNTDYLDDVSQKYWYNDQIEAVHGPVAAALADRSIRPDGSSFIRAGESGRGDPTDKDYYAFAQFTLAVKLGGGGDSQYIGGKGNFRTRNRCYQF
jgi:hypothetical protein